MLPFLSLKYVLLGTVLSINILTGFHKVDGDNYMQIVDLRTFSFFFIIMCENMGTLGKKYIFKISVFGSVVEIVKHNRAAE